MKQILIISILVLISTSLYPQKPVAKGPIDSARRENKDSLDLWEYDFIETTNTQKGEELGELILRRKKCIIDTMRVDSLFPQIIFSVYPISKFDSIVQLEDERGKLLGCCYPICGATICKTEKYVFWSTPWEITCAFGCGGTDYTRWNATQIIEKVSSLRDRSLVELINLLPIKRRDN